MKTHKYYGATLFLLVIIAGALFCFITKLNDQNRHTKALENSMKTTHQMLNDAYKVIDSRIAEFKMESSKINLSAKLTNIERDTIPIRKIIQDKAKLILRLSENTCTSCIEGELNNISELGKIMGNGNVVLITDYANIRDYMIFANAIGRGVKTYNLIKNNEIFAQKIAIDKPLLFILQPNFYIKYVYTLDRDYPEINATYYQLIRKIISSKM